MATTSFPLNPFISLCLQRNTVKKTRDFKIVHDGRLGRLDAYAGDLGRVR